jgi:hypothetical protein
VHSSALPPALQELLPEAAARKRTKKRGIKEGRGSKEAQAHAHTYIHTHILRKIFPTQRTIAYRIAGNPKKEIEERVRVDVDIRSGERKKATPSV